MKAFKGVASKTGRYRLVFKGLSWTALLAAVGGPALSFSSAMIAAPAADDGAPPAKTANAAPLVGFTAAQESRYFGRNSGTVGSPSPAPIPRPVPKLERRILPESRIIRVDASGVPERVIFNDGNRRAGSTADAALQNFVYKNDYDSASLYF